MVYPVNNTTAQATITAIENWTHPSGNPRFIVHDRGTAYINTEFINWTKKLGIFLRPGTNSKIESQNQLGQRGEILRTKLETTGLPKQQNLFLLTTQV